MPVYKKINNGTFFVEYVTELPPSDDYYYEKDVTDYYYIRPNDTVTDISGNVCKDVDVLRVAAFRKNQMVSKCVIGVAPLEELPVHIAWTGGWDSTFRLCELLFNELRIVQPVYIIPTLRPDLPEVFSEIEQGVQKRVYEKLRKRSSKLLPIITYRDTDFTDYAELIRTWKKYRPKPPYRASPQYFMIAMCIARMDIPDLEVCVEQNEAGPAYHTDHVLTNCIYHGKGHQCRQRDNKLGMDGFRSPISHLTKQQMAAIAVKSGFIDILEHTWTCRNPQLVKEGMYKHCGACFTCREARYKGQSDRLNIHFTLD